MDEDRTRLSDNQRRFICRTVFLLLCVLPTSCALYSVFHRPGTREWVQHIQSNLPLKVDLVSVETPLPKQAILRGLQILPSDSGLFEELDGFVADEVVIEFGRNQNEILFVHPMQIEMRTFAGLLSRMVDELDDSTLGNQRWQFSFSKVTLVDSKLQTNDFVLKPMSVTLDRGRSNLDSNSEALQARVLAPVDSDQPDKQLSLEFQKMNQGWLLTIDARQAAIPSNLLRHFVDEVPMIGSGGHFTGQIELLVDHEGKTRGTVEGQIKDVRLDKFKLGSGTLAGICNIDRLYCEINDGRIGFSAMQVVSESPISVSREFLNTAYDFGIEDCLDPQLSSFAISKLDLGVTFQNGSVFLSGPKQPVPRGGTKEMADCIAFQRHKGELSPVVICNAGGRRSIKLGELAKVVNGYDGNRTSSFMNFFNLSDRTANQQIGGGDLR